MDARPSLPPDLVPDSAAVCPQCQATASVPIEYGYPGPDMIQQAAAGLIQLGGCRWSTHSPTRQCRACGHAWRTHGIDSPESLVE